MLRTFGSAKLVVHLLEQLSGDGGVNWGWGWGGGGGGQGERTCKFRNHEIVEFQLKFLENSIVRISNWPDAHNS
jgi:hypothetical protein